VSLRPLPYHLAVAAILQRENPKAFAALRPDRTERADTAQFDQFLLRKTYRFDTAAHPEVHAPVRRAATALGVEAPIEIYAAESVEGTNAELLYLPDRIVLLLTGNVPTLLDADELCAVAGHELAHHLLWNLDDGGFLAAQRLLDAADVDARTPSEYLETARRYRLATELLADRGSYLACGSLPTTISALLKVATGLSRVDAEAYQRQAWEVDYTRPSNGTTHPETVLRAWALQQWLERGDDGEELIERALAPELDLASLDLPGQDRLEALTRALVAAVISQGELFGEEVAALAERYGVAAPITTAPLDAQGLAAVNPSAETRRYLAAVVLDLATADPESRDDVLRYVIGVGRALGLGAELDRLVAAELPGVRA
jgi:hypothetical protein